MPEKPTVYPRLSASFGGSECVAGAAQRNMDLGPLPPGIEERMRFMAENLLEPWRAQVGPLRVNRWWVNEELNRLQNGVANSQHLLGEAIDVSPARMELRLAFELLVHSTSKLTFDQAILYPHRGFIHVSLKSGDRAERLGNRSQALFNPSRSKTDAKRYFPYDDYGLYLDSPERYLSIRRA